MATAPATEATLSTGVELIGGAIENATASMTKSFEALFGNLRSEFSAQNKLLGWQGKNLQSIAQAITKTSAALLKQEADQFRQQQETLKETAAAAAATPAGGEESVDKSLQLDVKDLGSLTGIAAALAGLAVGFIGYIAQPLTMLARSIGKGLSGIGKMFMKNKMVKNIIFRAKWLWIDIKFAVDMIKGKFVRFKNLITGFFKKPLVNNKLILGIKNAIVGPLKALSKGPIAIFKTISADVKAFKAMFSGAGTGFMGKIKNFFTNFKAMFNIKGGFIDDIMKSVTKFKGVFDFFKKIGRFLGKAFVIFQVITALFDFWGGFVETEGNFVAKLAGGLGAAIKGFLGGFLDIGIMIEDGIKWIIAKIAGFLGFDEAAVSGAMGSFSFFGTIKDALFLSIDYLTGLFKFEDTSFGGIAKSLVDIIFAPLNLAIMWVQKLFGWGDSENPFTFSGLVMGVFDKALAWLNKLFVDPVGALTGLVAGYFGGALNIADWLIEMIKKPVVWLLELFGWDDAAAATESFSCKDSVMKVFDKAVAWITGIFADPVGALTTLVSGYFGGILNIADWLTEMIKKPIVWLLSVFGWDDAAESVEKFSLKGFVFGVIEKVKGWVKGLFSWAASEDENDSFIVKTIKSAITLAKTWLTSMFKFDSTTDILASAFNALTFLPNLVFKGITAVASWLAGLLGFNEASKKIANAGKFSLGDILFSAIDNIWKWFKSLLDIDVAAIAKQIPGAETLLDWMSGGKGDKSREEIGSLGEGIITDKGGFMDDMEIDLDKLKESMKGMSVEQIAGLGDTLTTMNKSVGKGADIENFGNIMKAVEAAGMNAATSGQSLNTLQKEKDGLNGTGQNITVVAPTTITQNSSQGFINPPQPVRAAVANHPARRG